MIRKVIAETGKCLRETGQALDRLGCRAMGDHVSFRETWSRHRKLMNLYNKRPVVAVDSFIAPNASVIGDVNIGDKTSVWYGAVIRGDVNKIRVGSISNIQDRVVIHASKPNKDGGFPTTTTIGDFVTVGHGAVLSSCVIENNVLIGPNALILDGALVESNSIIEPGSVVPPGRR
jgi:carbonic anhydrase/acetyltransferase-like protein (isoleucine patch superfamily)